MRFEPSQVLVLELTLLSLGTLPLILPPFIGAYSSVRLFGRRGMITYFLKQWLGIGFPDIYGAPGVIIAMSPSYYPFVFLLTYGALLSADPSLEESAEIMGASRLRIARTVTLPLVLQAMLGGNYHLLPTLIYFQVTGHFDLNAAGATSMGNVALVAVAIFLSQRVTAGRSYVTISSRTQAARQSPSRLLMWLGFAFCALVVLLSLLPHLPVIFTSFTEGWRDTRYPTKFSLQNCSRVFQIARQPLTNSLLLATVAAVVASVIGTLLAYISTRRGMRLRWLLDFTVMLPFILPGIIVGVAILVGFSSGLLVPSGTWLILVVGYFIRRILMLPGILAGAVIVHHGDALLRALEDHHRGHHGLRVGNDSHRPGARRHLAGQPHDVKPTAGPGGRADQGLLRATATRRLASWSYGLPARSP